MESLASAADKQRAVVTEVLKETSLGLNAPRAAAVNNMEAIENNITMVTEEARAASQTTTERFDEIEKIVKRERERALSEIDQRLWKQLDPMEPKKQRLDSLLNRQATVLEVATRVTSPASSDVGVLQVTGSVVDNLLEVSKGLRAEGGVDPPSFLFVKPATLDGINDLLQQTVQIYDGVRMDLSKSTLNVPGQRLRVGLEERVVVRLADSTGRVIPRDQPVPDVKAEVILPSGARQPVNITSLRSNSSKLVIPICAAEPGYLTLELASHGTSCEFRIEVKEELSFDPMNITARLMRR